MINLQAVPKKADYRVKGLLATDFKISSSAKF